MQFDKKQTSEQKFSLTAEKTTRVPMMYRSGEHRLYEDKDLQMLELPYKGKELSMLVLLPRNVTGLDDLEKNFSATQVSRFLKDMPKERTVDVTLPKFKVEQDLPLTNVLKAMGMKEAFDRDLANFKGMAIPPPPDENLYISAVLHKAFVEVNEEGTEAAAATAVVVSNTFSLRIRTAFLADHPFVFLIRDNRNGSVLFMGRVSDPSVTK